MNPKNIRLTNPTAYEKKKASVKARQKKLRDAGICLRCSKRKANRGVGATKLYCPFCAKIIRENARQQYRKANGLDPDAPVKKTGRPLVRPSKAIKVAPKKKTAKRKST